MMDFTKIKKLTIGGVELKQLFINGVQVWKSGPKNWIKYSTESDGVTIYNNGLGYKENTRLNSSAAEVNLDGYGVCGYIPAKAGDIIRVKDVMWDSAHQTGGYFCTYNSGFAGVKSTRPTGGSNHIVCSTDEDGVFNFKLVLWDTSVAYIRLSAYGLGANTVITVNEEIT